MLVDPAVNLVFDRMKSQLSDYKDKLEQAQSDLSAWKFTPDRLADNGLKTFREHTPYGTVILSFVLNKIITFANSNFTDFVSDVVRTLKRPNCMLSSFGCFFCLFYKQMYNLCITVYVAQQGLDGCVCIVSFVYHIHHTVRKFREDAHLHYTKQYIVLL